MEKKKRQLNKGAFNKISISVIAGILAFAVSCAAVQYIDLDPWMMFSYARIFITVIFTMSLCILIFRSWKTFLITLGVLFFTAAVIAIIWLRTGIPEAFEIAATDYFTWLWHFITQWSESMELTWNFSYITSVGVSVLITMMMYFLLVKWYVYLPVFILSISLFVSQWAVVREVNKFAFYLTLGALVILYFLQVFHERIKKIEKKGEEQSFMSPGKFILAAIPVIMILLFTVMLIPKSAEPITWKWLDDRIKYRNLGGDKPIDFKAYDQFSLANTGFSAEAGTPGGSVELDYSHILDVYSSEITYLRGESWPYFDGKSWGGSSAETNYSEPIVKYHDYEPERRMLLEPIYGWRFMNLNDWLQADFSSFLGERVLPGPDFNSVMGDHLLPGWYSRKTVDIVYAGVESKTLFSPMYSMLTSFNGLSQVFVETDDTLETEETIKLFSFIHYDYLSMNKENTELLETLKRSRRGIYYEAYTNLAYITINEDAYDNIQIANSMMYTLQDLYELYAMSEDYYWRYTEVPESLPERVVETANEIAAPFDNDYEKVNAIEKYFHEGFSYSLIVPDVPADRNFVDWFMFDSKVGYCTYYATSMVTLVRSIGLPARYIEGFVTPAGPQPGSRYPVLNSNAHAWVEVYFEGIGWVQFEPTPPFAGVLEEEDDTPIDLGDEFVDPLDEHLDELDKEDLTSPNIIGGGSNDSRRSSLPLGWLIAIIIVGSMIFMNVTVSLSRKILFKNIKGEKRFRIGYFEILRILSIRGIRLKRGMTLKELAGKIDDVYFATHVSMEDLTNIYYRVIYDENEIPNNEFRKMEVFYKEFRYEFNNELKLWEWFVYRVLFPII